MNLIDVVDVRKQYQNHLALDDVSFSIKEGQIFGLLGPNGAGKTTFIRILNQITAADSGNISFKGTPLTRKHIENIGYLPEERGLYKKMKVGEQAMYLARLKGMSKERAKEELKKWFVKFEISSWWDKKVEELSKGMAQKIQFITTVLHNPNLLIFDEPFSGFDPINVNILKEEILKLRDNGATVIFSTHNMSSVEELCDSIVLIDNAKILLEGDVKDIKKKFAQNKYYFEVKVTEDEDVDTVMNDLNVSDYNLSDNIVKGVFLTKDNDNNILLNGGSNAVINKLMQVGELISFHEILPTMNDVFINAVTNKNYE